MLLKLTPLSAGQAKRRRAGAHHQGGWPVYGTVACLVSGGILGGWLISRFGFKRCVWPMVRGLPCICSLFTWPMRSPSINLVYPLVALEQFGLGFTVFTVYLMYSAQEVRETSALCHLHGHHGPRHDAAGFVSGWLQQSLGYTTFFIIVCVMTVPGMLTIPFLPNMKRDAETAGRRWGDGETRRLGDTGMENKKIS